MTRDVGRAASECTRASPVAGLRAGVPARGPAGDGQDERLKPTCPAPGRGPDFALISPRAARPEPLPSALMLSAW
jgi:hypothetical protein